MVTVRSAKAKGSSFEYDCQYSLSTLFTDIYRTSERGFQLQYDLKSDIGKIVIECKRLKGVSWNQLVKLYKKLCDKKPTEYTPYLLFQSNFQPCLVFYKDNTYKIEEFESVFKIEFHKHKSTR